MPYDRDTRVVQSNIVLDRGQSPQEGEIWGSEPLVRRDDTYRQITLASVIYILCICVCYLFGVLLVLSFSSGVVLQ